MLDMAVSLHTSFPSVCATQGEKTEALRGSEEGTGGEREREGGRRGRGGTDGGVQGE